MEQKGEELLKNTETFKTAGVGIQPFEVCLIIERQ